MNCRYDRSFKFIIYFFKTDIKKNQKFIVDEKKNIYILEILIIEIYSIATKGIIKIYIIFKFTCTRNIIS